MALGGSCLQRPGRGRCRLRFKLKSVIRRAWKPEDRRALLKLLSRLPLDVEQATRWYQATERIEAGIQLEDREILDNPYLIYERDRVSADPITFTTVDRGVFPDPLVRDAHRFQPFGS